MDKITLGDTVKDTITGLVGIATVRCNYIHGCDHIGIQPRANNKTGEVPQLVWVDYPQVVVTREVRPNERKRTSKPGGPSEHPRSRNHPRYDEGTIRK